MPERAMPSDDTLIERFLEMLSAERNAAANTRAAYRRDLDDAATFMASRKTALGDTATADLSAYLAALDRRGLAARSAARRLSALRQFFKFLVAEAHRSDDPTAALDGPKLGRPFMDGASCVVDVLRIGPFVLQLVTARKSDVRGAQ